VDVKNRGEADPPSESSIHRHPPIAKIHRPHQTRRPVHREDKLVAALLPNIGTADVVSIGIVVPVTTIGIALHVKRKKSQPKTQLKVIRSVSIQLVDHNGSEKNDSFTVV